MKNTRRARLVLTILLLVAFTLITLDYRSGAAGGGRQVASDIFGPIENTVGDVVHPVGSWFTALGHLGSYKSENEKLRRELAAANSQLRLTATEQSQLTQAKKLLHLDAAAQDTVVAAQVTAYGGADSFDYTVTINRGSAEGIRVNQTVINGDGLVGQTIRVSRSSATVQLADDPEFTVGVKLDAPTEEAGFLDGGGLAPMALTMIDPQAVLHPGEKLVTLGSTVKPGTDLNVPFVPEIPIGYISTVTPPNGGLTPTATVIPYVDYTALDVVAVDVKPPKTPVRPFSVLPASPTPAPTITIYVTPTPGLTPSSSSSPSNRASTHISSSP
jgi:rod shape-determining protein MreC